MNPNHIQAQITLPPDYPIQGIVGILADILSDRIYQTLRDHPERCIKREIDPETSMQTCHAKLIFVRQDVILTREGGACNLPPDVHPEDSWVEESRHLNCPLCNGSGHVDDARRCKRCNTPIQPGIAIAQTYTTGGPDFPSDADDPNAIVTLSPGGPGKLINCLKCPQCGWSITKQEAS